MSLSLRDATLADLPVITGIYRESVLNGVATYEIVPPSEAEMRSRFETIVGNGYPYMVACNGSGSIVGYAYASAFRTRTAYRFLVEDSIYLAPNAVGRGIGRALLTQLIARCTEIGKRQMIAVIGDSANLASIELHRVCGFRLVGTFASIGFKHGRWVDSVLMQRQLGAGADSLPG